MNEWYANGCLVFTDDAVVYEAKNLKQARLIAAAPNMLEALQALERQALQSDVNKPANEWGQEALAMARAAIAKATGNGTGPG